MKNSLVKIQQSVLLLSDQNNQIEIEIALKEKLLPTHTQISINNSKFNHNRLPKLVSNVQKISIKKCQLKHHDMPLLIFGQKLKIVEISYSNISIIPKIQSNTLITLNLSHNIIQKAENISHLKSLKTLDLQDNRIVHFSYDLLSKTNMMIKHEFIEKEDQIFLKYHFESKDTELISIEEILRNLIFSWEINRIITICQSLIQSQNQFLLSLLEPYMTNDFKQKIFQIAKIKRKFKIIDYLTTNNHYSSYTIHDCLMTLSVNMLSQALIKEINLQNLVQALCLSGNQKDRVNNFLFCLTKLVNYQNIFIKTEADLFYYISLNLQYSNSYEIDFLFTQISFFDSYDFQNQMIAQYLLQFDNQNLIRILTYNEDFKNLIFLCGLYKKFVKPIKKTYKILQSMDKKYIRQKISRKSLYFPEYRQRKSFCIKNDLYDYDILKEYEQMQGSYSKKDLKFVFKFCNKQNHISIAQRIQSELKKPKMKHLRESTAETIYD